MTIQCCPELYTIVIQAVKKNGTCADLEEQTNALEATFHSTLMFSLSLFWGLCSKSHLVFFLNRCNDLKFHCRRLWASSIWRKGGRRGRRKRRRGKTFLNRSTLAWYFYSCPSLKEEKASPFKPYFFCLLILHLSLIKSINIFRINSTIIIFHLALTFRFCMIFWTIKSFSSGQIEENLKFVSLCLYSWKKKYNFWFF